MEVLDQLDSVYVDPFLLPRHCLRGVFISEVSHRRLQPPCTHLPRIRRTYGCLGVHIFLDTYTHKPGTGRSGRSSSLLTGSHQPHSGMFFAQQRVTHNLSSFLQHTLIFPGLLVEGLTYFHPLPSRKAGIRSVVLSHGAYFVWVLYCGYFQGTWIYPFLAMMALPLKVAFGLVQLGVSVGVYILFEKWHQFVWASELKED